MQGGPLGDEKGDDGGEHGQVGDTGPDLARNRHEQLGRGLEEGEEEQPAAAGDQDPEGHHRHGLAAVEQLDERRVQGHEQAAAEKEQVPPIELQGAQLRHLPFENHPQGADHGEQQGEDAPRAQPFPQEKPAVDTGDARHHGEQYAGVQGVGEPETEEHQPEKADQGNADQTVAAERRQARVGQAEAAADVRGEEQGRQTKTDQGEQYRVHERRDRLAHRKRGGNKHCRDEHAAVQQPG